MKSTLTLSSIAVLSVAFVLSGCSSNGENPVGEAPGPTKSAADLQQEGKVVKQRGGEGVAKPGMTK